MDAGTESKLAVDPSRLQVLEERLRDLEKRLAMVEGQAAEDRSRSLFSRAISIAFWRRSSSPPAPRPWVSR